MTTPAVLLGLIEDALSEPAELGPAVAAHRERQHGPYASLLGPLRIPDRRLADLGRAASETAPVGVCVVSSTGAGGLLSLANRSVPGVRVLSAESALRDLDDLAGNAARVVAASAELGEVEVFVELPYHRGWPRAVSVLEEGGLHAAVRAGAPSDAAQLAEQLSALVEADVAFKVSAAGLSVVGLLAAVEALVEGADVADAAQLLVADPTTCASRVASWDGSTAARMRRRLRLVSCSSVPDVLTGLAAVGLVSP